MSEQQQGFWSSIPGMLTGLAAVITAVTGLFIALNGSDSEKLNVTIEDENTVSSTSYVEPAIVNPVAALETDSESPVISLNALVDCEQFPTKNSVTSLMSWSDYYHKQIVKAGASKDACNKAIGYRAQAHCKKRNDLTIRQGLAETISQCNTIKFSWKDVKL